MRQGQQNRRGRGRNNNHNNNNGARKGQNPLARSFESSGPDVKLRGTPAHIAEKYMALARDAQSSGDPVLAENYLQHAEHYNRIIMAYREQQMSQGGEQGPGGVPRVRPPFGSDPGEQGGEFGDDDGEDLGPGASQPMMGMGEQPAGTARLDERPRFEGRPQREPRPEHAPRSEQHRYPPRDRHSGEPRGGFHERGDRGERPERPEHNRPERVERARLPQTEGMAGDGPPRRRDRFQPPTTQHEQPEFLRRPVRRPRREEGGETPPQPAPASEDQE